jgi:hypothetical protein
MGNWRILFFNRLCKRPEEFRPVSFVSGAISLDSLIHE